MIVGAWWINNYPNGRGNNLTFCDDQALGIMSLLSSQAAAFGDGLAFDKHFESVNTGSPPAGESPLYIDMCDFVYFSGHGNENGPIFGVNEDSGQAYTDECRWGQTKLKWIVLDACRILSEPNVKGRWNKVFAGIRYILSFESDAVDEPYRGTKLAAELNSKQWTIREAWQRVCETTCGSTSDRWAWLRASGPSLDDKWDSSSLPSITVPPSDTEFLGSSC